MAASGERTAVPVLGKDPSGLRLPLDLGIGEASAARRAAEGSSASGVAAVAVAGVAG